MYAGPSATKPTYGGKTGVTCNQPAATSAAEKAWYRIEVTIRYVDRRDGKRCTDVIDVDVNRTAAEAETTRAAYESEWRRSYSERSHVTSLTASSRATRVPAQVYPAWHHPLDPRGMGTPQCN
jgi:hypothetical protein